jgi:hypothetical protein
MGRGVRHSYEDASIPLWLFMNVQRSRVQLPLFCASRVFPPNGRRSILCTDQHVWVLCLEELMRAFALARR